MHVQINNCFHERGWYDEWMESLQWLIRVTLGANVLSLFVIGLVAWTGVVCVECIEINAPAGLAATPWTALTTWDAQSYLSIAEFGYPTHGMLLAYYPLFPLLIHVFSALFFLPFPVAGFVLTTVLSLGSVVLLFDIVKKRWNERVAFVSALLLLAFPTSFSLHLVYSESLFLFLVLLLWYAWERVAQSARMRQQHARWWLGVICGVAILLPLSRPMGMLVSVPLLLLILQTSSWALVRRVLTSVVVCACLLLGFALYLAIMQHAAGRPDAGFIAQQFFVSQNDVGALLHPVQWVREQLFSTNITVAHIPGTSVWDRLVFLLFIASLIGMLRRLPTAWWVYAVFVGLLPALSGNLMSFPRYLVVIFPLFVWLALWLDARGWSATHIRWIALLLFIGQLVLLAFHSSGYWIA